MTEKYPYNTAIELAIVSFGSMDCGMLRNKLNPPSPYAASPRDVAVLCFG